MPILESEKDVQIAIGRIVLPGNLALPRESRGVVLFAHGSGSSRLSPRNRYAASVLQEAGLATLLFDLLTPEEERIDDVTAELRFDIPLLAARLVGATDWLLQQTDMQRVQLGYFGASTGAAAALIAAAQRTDVVRAVVSRGGRPDLAGPVLPNVLAPTLLIVGARDETVLRLNRQALADLKCKKELAIVPGATHLFEEPGTLEEAARLARDWFVDCLSGTAAGA